LDKLTYAGSLERLRDVSESARYRFVKGSIADRKTVDNLFQEEKPWAIVNFAAETHVDRSILDSTPFLHTNVMGVQVLLEVCRSCGVERFLHISTDEVYGDVAGQEPSIELSSLRPNSPYAASKASADLLCLAYHRTYDSPTIIVRSSNNYGPYQFPEKLIPLMVRNALLGDELPIYGDGLQRREWLFVEDNVRAILGILECGEPGEIYNVGTGEEYTNTEVVHAICRILAEETGWDTEQLFGLIRFVADRPGHDRLYSMNSELVRKKIGWRPELPFDEGLKHTMRWYIEHREWLEGATKGEYQDYYDQVYRSNWGKA